MASCNVERYLPRYQEPRKTDDEYDLFLEKQMIHMISSRYQLVFTKVRALREDGFQSWLIEHNFYWGFMIQERNKET